MKLADKYQLTDKQLLCEAYNSSAITHGNYEGVLATGFYILLLKYLNDGLDKLEAFDKANEFVHDSKNDEFNVLPCVKDILSVYLKKVRSLVLLDGVLNPEELAKECGSGAVATSCVGLAYYTFYKGQSLEDAIELSTNHSGDSDSTASLTGQLYVAHNNTNLDSYNRVDLHDVIVKLTH